jgi:two-component sensor histidine kinase
MWGIAAVFLFPVGFPNHQFLLSVFVTGIACGAAATYAPLKLAYVPTILAELTPLSGRFVYEGTETTIFIGVVVFCFSFVLLLNARNIEVLTERSFRLMFEKNDLLESLTDKTTTLEKLTETLQSEIEERRRAETSLSESLDEKEVLLREIHHRVKNNLQVMSSLIRLQRRYVIDSPFQMILREMEGRVMSMALVHEKLYRSDSLAHLRICDYFSGILNHLLATHGVDDSKIKVHLDLDDALIDISQAVPLGFILTELVSNCLKHAFPGGKPGQVRVTFQQAENSRMVLSVSDDGIGLPEHVRVETPETLGLRLVQLFARQINAALEIKPNGGTGFSVSLTLPEGSLPPRTGPGS